MDMSGLKSKNFGGKGCQERPIPLLLSINITGQRNLEGSHNSKLHFNFNLKQGLHKQFTFLLLFLKILKRSFCVKFDYAKCYFAFRCARFTQKMAYSTLSAECNFSQIHCLVKQLIRCSSDVLGLITFDRTPRKPLEFKVALLRSQYRLVGNDHRKKHDQVLEKIHCSII